MHYTTLFFLLLPCLACAQFAPPAGYSGTTAIHKDSANFVDWAAGCQLQRGPMDISNPSGGLATAGDSNSALGQAGDGQIVSLGDGGTATLTFNQPIANGTGPDFAIFENSFSATFLELAFVEVSSDGVHFVRFPAISNTDTNTQVGSFGSIDARQLYNLAGKYQANYGTPFDLQELADSTQVDINNITAIRIVDVVGCIQPAYARRDSRGHIINDPWNTPFASSGFDLDAVGVLHNAQTIGIEKRPAYHCSVFPNPVVHQSIQIETNLPTYSAQLYDQLGRLVLQQSDSPQQLNLAALASGTYILHLRHNKGHIRQVIIIRQ